MVYIVDDVGSKDLKDYGTGKHEVQGNVQEVSFGECIGI